MNNMQTTSYTQEYGDCRNSEERMKDLSMEPVDLPFYPEREQVLRIETDLGKVVFDRGGKE